MSPLGPGIVEGDSMTNLKAGLRRLGIVLGLAIGFAGALIIASTSSEPLFSFPFWWLVLFGLIYGTCRGLAWALEGFESKPSDRA